MKGLNLLSCSFITNSQFQNLYIFVTDKYDWLNSLNFDLTALAPQLSWSSSVMSLPYSTDLKTPYSLWDAFAAPSSPVPSHGGQTSARDATKHVSMLHDQLHRYGATSAFSPYVMRSGKCVSGMAEAIRDITDTALRLDPVKTSALREDFWPSLHRVST